jgi:hypothetical protein
MLMRCALTNTCCRYVTLEQGTERAFTGTTADGLPWDNKQKVGSHSGNSSSISKQKV